MSLSCLLANSLGGEPGGRAGAVTIFSFEELLIFIFTPKTTLKLLTAGLDKNLQAVVDPMERPLAVAAVSVFLEKTPRDLIFLTALYK